MTILVPNEKLKEQTINKIGTLDFGITILTIDEYLLTPTNDKVVIIDEFDYILLQKQYKVVNNKINGLWNLQDKTLITFTATSSVIFEKFASKVIASPKVLRFQSQYEFINGTTPIQTGHFKSSGSQ